MIRFNEQRLRYLQVAVQAGSLRAAAAQLGIAPSAISRQIALLEEELDIILIERHRRGMIPTQVGQLLLAYYREQTSHQADMLSKLEALRGLRTGHVAIVSGEGFADELVSGPIQAFRQRYPDITFSLTVYGSTEILRQVREDEADLGLIYNAPQDAGIVTRLAGHQPMHAIVNDSHPLRQRQSVRFEELAGWPVALMHDVYGIRQLIAHVEFTEKVRLSPVFTTNLIKVLSTCVASGQAITLLPPFSVAPELLGSKLHAIPIEHPLLQHSAVQLITRAGRSLSPAANQFIDYCARYMPSFQIHAPGA